MGFIKGLTLLLGLLVFCSSLWAGNQAQVFSEQSFYLGEKRTVSLEIPAEINTNNMVWSLNAAQIQQLDGGEFIRIAAQFVNLPGELKIDFFIPYMAPSFTDLPVTLMGYDPYDPTTTLTVQMSLTVRAELVIRFRSQKNSSPSLLPLSAQADSVFQWDVPVNEQTGEYRPLVINNHKKGVWVRFRYEDEPGTELERSGGYLIHIYRGAGEYIVHQPFDKDTHLIRSECPLEPISESEWLNPSEGLNAKGKNWSPCEFRGYVPPNAAYGFGYREHYLEDESNQKFVEIQNVGKLNKELIEALNVMGVDLLTGLCTSW